jgi:hypothetical protein
MFLNKNKFLFLGLGLVIVLGIFIYNLNYIFTTIHCDNPDVSLRGSNASTLRFIQNFVQVHNIHYDINNMNDFMHNLRLPSSELRYGEINGMYLNYIRINNNTILTVHPNIMNEHIETLQILQELAEMGLRYAARRR